MNQTQSTFSVNYILKKDKSTNGEAPVFLRITLNGKRADFSIKRSVPIDKWGGRKKLLGNSLEVKTFNRNLEQLANKAHEIYEKLLISGEPITAEIIKNQLIGKSQGEPQRSLFMLGEYHRKLNENIIVDGTARHYKTTTKYLKEFVKKRFNLSDIALEKIDYKFLVDFEVFLRAYEPEDHKKKINNNAVMKHLTRLRAWLNLALRLDWIQSTPFKKYKIKYQKSDRSYLSETELLAIESKVIKLPRLEVIRDIFVFCCYTGLSYSDIFSLSPDHIATGMDGEKWIFCKRQKTDQSFSVPLLPQALAILEKYSHSPRALANNRVLPVSSNQKTNAYLKELADICNIKKNLTFHLARHTFATTVTLSNGVPIESVSKMLGHTKIATTQIYAKVVERKVSEDMAKLKSKLNSGTQSLKKAN